MREITGQYTPICVNGIRIRLPSHLTKACAEDHYDLYFVKCLLKEYFGLYYQHELLVLCISCISQQQQLYCRASSSACHSPQFLLSLSPMRPRRRWMIKQRVRFFEPLGCNVMYSHRQSYCGYPHFKRKPRFRLHNVFTAKVFNG